MKAVIQRVSKCSVVSDGVKTAEIAWGLLVLIGVVEEDTKEDIDWLVNKIVNLRIFPDEAGVMNRSVMEFGGDIVVVSQFTLHASTRKGNRPSYIKAAKSEIAIPLYETFVKTVEFKLGRTIQTGRFGADMKVDLLNDGPVTIIIDTKNRE